MPLPDRFDDTIAFAGEIAVALGPIDANDKIKEVCAWVYRSTGRSRAGSSRDGDDITEPREKDWLASGRRRGARWVLALNKVGNESGSTEGPAFGGCGLRCFGRRARPESESSGGDIQSGSSTAPITSKRLRTCRSPRRAASACHCRRSARCSTSPSPLRVAPASRSTAGTTRRARRTPRAPRRATCGSTARRSSTRGGPAQAITGHRGTAPPSG